MFYAVWGVYISLAWWRRLNETAASGTGMASWETWFWRGVVGLSLGASVSVKWTGLATPGMAGIESLFGIWYVLSGHHRGLAPGFYVV